MTQETIPSNIEEIINDPFTKAYDEFMFGGERGRAQFREVIEKHLKQPQKVVEIDNNTKVYKSLDGRILGYTCPQCGVKNIQKYKIKCWRCGVKIKWID